MVRFKTDLTELQDYRVVVLSKASEMVQFRDSEVVPVVAPPSTRYRG
jgi:hypothetical protein